MIRTIALLILVIPGFIAGYGIKLMRDSVFDVFNPIYQNIWIQFFAGLIFFIAGLVFVAGFVLYRDRKRNKVQKKFSNK